MYKSIKERRIEAGYNSIRSFSVASGIGISTLTRIESGSQSPSPKDLLILADVFGVEVSELKKPKPIRNECKTIVMNLQDIENELKSKFGDIIEPIKCSLRDRERFAGLMNLGKGDF